ncbi:MAG: histidine kinase dimerization/phospho-acceptor domain-containing protein [Syntrophobacteraceae bacterium]
MQEKDLTTKELGRISEDIANRKYRIATASKKMIDTLWWMAENEKKYDLLKKEEYKEYSVSGQKEYETNRFDILWLGADGGDENPWDGLYREYQEQFEFGELAGTFNDMAARLIEEERMRSDFISMLSHEIRTPLTSIRESVNLIAEEESWGT